MSVFYFRLIVLQNVFSLSYPIPTAGKATLPEGRGISSICSAVVRPAGAELADRRRRDLGTDEPQRVAPEAVPVQVPAYTS